MTFVPPAAAVQPVDWATAEDAIYDWVTTKLGLSAIWENQNLPQPAYPYLSLLRQSEIDEGGVDEKRQRTLDVDDKVVGEDPTAGDPIINEESNYQPIQFTVTVQAHVDYDNGATDPGANAMKLISKLKRSLGQTTIGEALSVAGLSVVRSHEATDLSLVVNGEWLSRAAFDVIFRTASVNTERVEFIDKVHLVSTDLGVDTTVDAS